MSDEHAEVIDLRLVVHNFDCSCFCNLKDGESPRSFVCEHCGDEFGWCCGADDEAERETGIELCDPCAVYFYEYRERTGQWPIQTSFAGAATSTG